MTGPTHRQYSICFAVLTAILLYRKGITEINYYLSLPILLMAGRSGALFPDVDHTWQNVSDKTYINKIINTIIHITGGKHRSWQTHSWDICLIFTMFSYFIPNILFNLGKISAVNREVMCILLLGFSALVFASALLTTKSSLITNGILVSPSFLYFNIILNAIKKNITITIKAKPLFTLSLTILFIFPPIYIL